jgi:hypothetical protein
MEFIDVARPAPDSSTFLVLNKFRPTDCFRSCLTERFVPCCKYRDGKRGLVDVITVLNGQKPYRLP